MQIDSQFLLSTLERLVNTPSPVGDTARGIDACREILCSFDVLQVRETRKGALVATWDGAQNDAPRGVTAHVDTLGAVVAGIKKNGRLRLAQLGNFPWTAIENEGVTIRTFDGREYRGSAAISNASHHVHEEGATVDDLKFDAKTMEVRIDARTESAASTRALGIEVGDYVSFDPRFENNNGFIRSRHLDDKGCLAAMFAAIKAMRDAGLSPTQRVSFLVANYEEVGHGGSSGFPKDVADVLALDIAPLGSGQNSDEFSCSLCVRDEEGPYDVKMGRELRELATQHDIALKTDTYVKYCSDGDALWKAGADVRCALIGPGVDATHGYERTHLDALVATAQMVARYLTS